MNRKLLTNIPLLILVLYYLRQLFVYFNMSGFFIGDLGRELYAPLRVLQGQVIYKDFYWLYGPWSLWVNAFLYRLFSANSQVLYYLSILLGLFISLLVYRLSKVFSSSIIALLISMIYIKVAMFGFTWQSLILPGKFATLWGIFFSLLFLNYLIKNLSLNKNPSWFLVGLIGGLVVITKIDYAFAVLTCSFLGIFLLNKRKHYIKAILSNSLGIFVVLLPVVYWITVHQIKLQSIINNVFPSYSSSYWFTHRKFYEPIALLKALKTEVAVISSAMAFAIKRVTRFHHLLLVKSVAVGMAMYVINSQNTELFKFSFMWPLFIISLGIFILCYVTVTVPRQVKLSLLILTVFNMLLTLRDQLAVASFSMVFPLLIIVSGLSSLFKYSTKRITFNYRLGMVIIIIILLKIMSDQSTYLFNSQYSDKNFPVVTPRGSFVVEPSPGKVFFDAVAFLLSSKTSADEIVSFPMEASLPFFTLIQNPLPFDQFANGIIKPSEQEIIIKLLAKHRPRYITVSNYEFLGYFGLEYNKEIYEWILGHYEELIRFGCQYPYDKSIDCTGYGIRIFELKDVEFK